jgi:hypothetical protein
MRYLFLAIDSFTKYAWGRAFEKKESPPVAQYLSNLYMIEGAPDICQHDNGGEFLSEVMKDVQQLYKVKDVRTAPYHPQSDGQVERTNGTIKRMLQLAVESTKSPWSRCLPGVLYHYNNSLHSTTKAVPYEALRGRTGTRLDDGKSIEELTRLQMMLHDKMRIETQKAAQKMVARHSKKAKVISYEVGDRVTCRDGASKRKKKK